MPTASSKEVVVRMRTMSLCAFGSEGQGWMSHESGFFDVENFRAYATKDGARPVYPKFRLSRILSAFRLLSAYTMLEVPATRDVRRFT
jgi:hypothetical protein